MANKVEYALYYMAPSADRARGRMPYQPDRFDLNQYIEVYRSTFVTQPLIFTAYGEVDMEQDFNLSTDERRCTYMLESLFCEFAAAGYYSDRHPGFKGRPMRISDVIELNKSGEKPRYYYCEPFGWADVTQKVSEARKDKEGNTK